MDYDHDKRELYLSVSPYALIYPPYSLATDGSYSRTIGFNEKRNELTDEQWDQCVTWCEKEVRLLMLAARLDKIGDAISHDTKKEDIMNIYYLYTFAGEKEEFHATNDIHAVHVATKKYPVDLHCVWKKKDSETNVCVFDLLDQEQEINP